MKEVYDESEMTAPVVQVVTLAYYNPPLVMTIVHLLIFNYS